MCAIPGQSGIAKSSQSPFVPCTRACVPRLPTCLFDWTPFLLNITAIRTLTTDAGDLDLLAEVPGLGDFQRVRAASAVLEIEGLPCRVLGLRH